jgi:hypothetical protein
VIIVIGRLSVLKVWQALEAATSITELKQTGIIMKTELLEQPF